MGDMALEAPDQAGATNAAAVAYAGPHEIELDRYSPGPQGIRVQLLRAGLRVGGAA